MAAEVRVFHVTIPAGTPRSANFTADLSFPARQVDALEVVVPSGCRGEVGFAIGAAGVPVIPIQAGTFIVTDGEFIKWPLEGFHDSGSWTLFGYNTGAFTHTLEVRFLVSLVATGSNLSQPIPASQLVPVVDASPVLVGGGGGGGTTPTQGQIPVNGGLTVLPPPDVGVGLLAPPPVTLPVVTSPPGSPIPVLPPPPGVSFPAGATIPSPSSPSSTTGSTTVTVTRPIPTRMYDSTNAGDIPSEAVAVAFYDYWPSSTPSPRLDSRFYVVLTKYPDHLDADAFDVEGGAGTLADAYTWAQAKAARGQAGVVYATGSTHDQLTQMIAFHGGVAIARWLADYDNDPTLPAGYVAKQYANPPLTGHHYDVSSLSPDFPRLRAWAGGTASGGTIAPPASGGGGFPYLEGQNVEFTTWAGASHIFRVTPSGELVQESQAPGQPWVRTSFGFGFIPGALDVFITGGNELHVVTMRTDGRVHHQWVDQGSTTWGVQDFA